MRYPMKRVLCAFLCASLLMTLSGCQPSKKKVLQSDYYKDLQKENKKLKKKVKKLERKVEKENNISEDAKRAQDYLDKIGRDHIIKMEVGYADNMEGGELFSDKKAAFAMATAIATRADECSHYTQKEIAELYGPGYEYILYDEDNACYEIMIYDGNYVVFPDLPDRVYYSYDASALGEAFLHYKNGYPNSSMFHRFADTPFIYDQDENYYDRRTAAKAANTIDRMAKARSSKKKAEKEWGKSQKGTLYTFCHHGNVMTLTLFDRYIRMENMDGEIRWYKISEDNMKTLRDIFEKGKNPGKAETKETDSKKEVNEPTHYEEMNSEGSTQEQ